MLKRVKNWLGIEGVKMEIETADRIRLRDGVVKGTIIFQSLQEKTITKIRFKLVEKYFRGRGRNKLIDEYILGKLEIDKAYTIQANGQLLMDFKLLFTPKESPMDEYGRNLLLRGPVAIAKALKGARSKYRLEVEAKVQGTALNPIAQKEIRFY